MNHCTSDALPAACRTVLESNPSIDLGTLIYLLKYMDDPLTCLQTNGRGLVNTPLLFKAERLCTPLVGDYTPANVLGMTPWILDECSSEWWCTREGPKTEQLMNGARYFVKRSDRGGYVRVQFVSRQPIFDDACLHHREGTDIKSYLTNYLLNRVSVCPR